MRDCAKIHVVAMEKIDIASGESYISSSRTTGFLEFGIRQRVWKVWVQDSDERNEQLHVQYGLHGQ